MEQVEQSKHGERKSNFFEYLISNSFYMRHRTLPDLFIDILILLSVATLMTILILLNFNITEK